MPENLLKATGPEPEEEIAEEDFEGDEPGDEDLEDVDEEDEDEAK